MGVDQSLGVGRFDAAILPSPVAESGIADPVLTAHVRRAHARLVFFQNAYDLRFTETASLHLLSPQLENRLTSNRGPYRGQVSSISPITNNAVLSPNLEPRIAEKEYGAAAEGLVGR